MGIRAICGAFLAAVAVLVAVAAQGSARLGIGLECLDRDLWDIKPALGALKELGVALLTGEASEW